MTTKKYRTIIKRTDTHKDGFQVSSYYSTKQKCISTLNIYLKDEYQIKSFKNIEILSNYKINNMNENIESICLEVIVLH